MLSLAVAASTSTSAHHSAAAAYEAAGSIRIEGRVVEFAWTNPHAHVYIHVSEGPFKGRTYVVELSSAAALANEGWTKTSIKAGDDVVFHVHPSRSGAPAGLCRKCAVTIKGRPQKAAGH